MPNGNDQEYNIKLGGVTYKFKADAGLSQEAAIDYASKKYPKFAEAYKQHQQPKAEAPHWGFSSGDYQRAAGMDQTKLPGYFQPMSPTGISVDPQHARTEAETLGAGLGSLGLGELAALRAGGAMLPKIVQFVARATGATVGATGTGTATGEKPLEALKTGQQFGATELGGELALGSVKSGYTLFSKLWKADPKRLADLADLISVEEKTLSEVQSGAPKIRQSINASYPKVDTKVRIMPAAKVAQQAEGTMVAEAAPKQVSHLADLGRARQQQALRLLSKAARIIQDMPEGASDEVQAILAKAKDLQGIDFLDAQKLYSSLGRAAAKGAGYKLSGEQIFALNQARDAMESSMRDALHFETVMGRTAKAAGVMPEGELGDFYRFRDSQTGGSFSVRKSEYSAEKLASEVGKLRKSIPDTTQLDPLAQQKVDAVRQRFQSWEPADKLGQWEKAQADHRQFIEDFYKPGGALTGIMNAAPEERGEVLKQLLSKPDTRIRATKALARYGFDTKDVIRLASKWRDPTELNRAIADAARLEQVGQDIFGKQEASAARKAVGKQIVKKGITGALGLAGYELWKALQSKSPNLMRTQY